MRRHLSRAWRRWKRWRQWRKWQPIGHITPEGSGFDWVEGGAIYHYPPLPERPYLMFKEAGELPMPLRQYLGLTDEEED